MDAQFADPVSDRRCIARMSMGKTIQAGGDQRPYSLSLELRPPLGKDLRLRQSERGAM